MARLRRADMSADQLRAWMKRYRWSLTTGADILGVSRRALQQYLHGRERIPLPVARLCWAYDRIRLHENGQISLRREGDILEFPEQAEEPLREDNAA